MKVHITNYKKALEQLDFLSDNEDQKPIRHKQHYSKQCPKDLISTIIRSKAIKIHIPKTMLKAQVSKNPNQQTFTPKPF